jgi:hypothetical protein
MKEEKLSALRKVGGGKKFTNASTRMSGIVFFSCKLLIT